MPIYVNQERIDPDLIEQEFSAIKAHYESLGRSSCCERDEEFRTHARENIVARVLISQEARRRGLDVSRAEIDEALERLKTDHGGEQQFYENIGVQPCQVDEVKKDIEHGLRVEKTLKASIGPVIDPDEAAVRAFFDAHITDYLTEEERRASHLFKQVEKVEERQQIYDLLRSLRQQARAGADFDALALEHTDKDDKVIDLGWFKQTDFMDEFGVIAFSLEEGEVSPVFASYFGFHLARCTGIRPAVPRPFDGLRDEVRNRMIQEDQQEKSRAFVAQLQAAAEIEEREDEEPA